MSSVPALNYASPAPAYRRIEERSHLRFPIALDVQYKYKRNGIEYRGIGRTLNIGSGGVLFEADEVLRPFDFERLRAIEVTLSWPCLLNETCPLKLVIRGSVLRRMGRQIAVEISQHTFCTAGHNLQGPMPQRVARKK